jgi:hypothetical protein
MRTNTYGAGFNDARDRVKAKLRRMKRQKFDRATIDSLFNFLMEMDDNAKSAKGGPAAKRKQQPLT